jgi:hypothetical protein
LHLHCGERYHHSERISTGFVESAVSQIVSKRMVKQQQMPWTKRGAHLLLWVRIPALTICGSISPRRRSRPICGPQALMKPYD